MAFTNKAEKGAVQRGTGTATTTNKAEKGAVQRGASTVIIYQPRPGFILYNDPGQA